MRFINDFRHERIHDSIWSMKGWGTSIGGSEGGGGALGTRAPLGVFSFITGRNEVVAKVMFLHVSVILSRGGVLQAERPPRLGDHPPPGTRQTPPPGWENPPLWLGDHPPGPGRPPRLGEPPQDQADPPGWETTPPGPGGPPPPAGRPPPPGPGRPPPPGSRLQNTVHERPVRILLECILVFM